MKTLLWFCVLLCSCSVRNPDRAIIEAQNPPISCSLLVTSSNCNFYDCLESNFTCGNTGYPLGYGKPYCEKFASFCDNSLKSQAAQTWVTHTTTCLQQELEKNLSTMKTCGGVESAGFGSHAYCYTKGAAANGGVSFCSLTAADWVSVRSCIALRDRLSLLGLKQIATVSLACARIFAGGLSLEGNGDDILDPQTAASIASMSQEERSLRAQEFAAFAQELQENP